ncbi:MAG TPA: D-arabinono-1,4-lactone oxidase, partial [Streptosporangiaceae bacterium]|nr:D-arabinono-1,4-lactone oxidase [Streptosporangiaceae bacterium]
MVLAVPRWQNWAGNQAAAPQRMITPRSAEEVAEAVTLATLDGLTVRMTGAGHSFTPVAVTSGVMMGPGGLRAIRGVDEEAGEVTVEAGCRLRDLNEYLDARGLALANMGDIQEQTVAGAIQTGTHGTGRDLGGIAAQVTALEMVLADGSIVSCSASQAAELFQAARIGLGALGVLTAVTFRVVPGFLLTAREEPMNWAEVIARLDELASANQHFEFYWFPHTDGCLVKRNNRSDGPPRPLPRWRHQLDDEFLSNTVFGATCRLGHAVPAVIKTVNGASGKALGSRSYVDAPYKVFTSPRRVRFKEQEYAIPRESLADVLAEVRALFSRRD